MQISVAILVGKTSAGISYASKLIKAFKARVLSYPTSIFEAEACLDATLTELNAIGLLKEASLVITPNAYNEGILYDVVPNTTLGDMTVVRATTATRVNSAGLIEVVPRNLLTYSNTFTNAAWGSYNQLSLTANAGISPDETNNAFLFTKNIASTVGLKVKNIPTLTSGFTYTLSVFVKKATVGNTAILRFAGDGFPPAIICEFNFDTETITNGGSFTKLTNGWYRISKRRTATSTGNGNFQIGVTSILATDLNNVLIYGAQLDQSSLTEYFPTTTRLNIPRIDYTNGSCPSLLVEPQRTNLVTYSEQFNNAAWSKINSLVTANTTISPSGVVNADTLTTLNPSSESFIRYSNFSITANVGSSYTTTVFAKKGTGNFLIIRNLFVQNGATSGKAWFNLNTGVIGTVESSQTASMQNMGNGWYRCTLTGIVGSLSNFNFIDFGLTDTNGSSSSSVSVNGYVWGAQLEQGSNATSYIPTIASTVTRNDDVISKTGISSLIGQTEGTVFFDLNTIKLKPDFNRIMLSDGTDSFRLGITSDLNFTQLQCIYVSTQTFSSNVLALPIATNIKIAIKYSIGELKFFANGVLVSSFSPLNDFSINNLSQFRTGRPAGGREFFGEINSILLWKTKLTDQECINLTTL